MKLSVDIRKRLGHFNLESRFDVEDECFALFGSSGAGKSVTLKCIAGIITPDSGRIILGDRVLFDSVKKINVPARDRHIGYLFQNHALFPNMTVRENILFTAADRKYGSDLIERFSLNDVIDQYPGQLSGGQSQRTALARMLATKPQVILMDEPLSELDNYLRTMIEREIQEILDDFKGPAVLVSHDRNEVYRLCENICLITDGKTSEVQSRDEFFGSPSSVIQARLTGCKNISSIDETGYAREWGIRLSADPAGMGYVGFRAHYFIFVDDNKSNDVTDVFDAQTVRITEDAFSVIVCFRQTGNDSSDPDSVLTWIVGKDKWKEVRSRVESGRFRLKTDPARIFLMRE